MWRKFLLQLIEAVVKDLRPLQLKIWANNFGWSDRISILFYFPNESGISTKFTADCKCLIEAHDTRHYEL